MKSQQASYKDGIRMGYSYAILYLLVRSCLGSKRSATIKTEVLLN